MRPNRVRIRAQVMYSRCSAARDPNVGKTALLLQLLIVGEGAAVREHPFLAADDEHDRELQPLGAVHRHQNDRILRRLVLVHGVDIGDERQVGQEGDERLVVVALLELHRHGQELLDVLYPRLGLQRVLTLQLDRIFRQLQHLLRQLRHRQVVAHAGQVVHHRAEVRSAENAYARSPQPHANPLEPDR